jgi:hypothetical protein
VPSTECLGVIKTGVNLFKCSFCLNNKKPANPSPNPNCVDTPPVTNCRAYLSTENPATVACAECKQGYGFAPTCLASLDSSNIGCVNLLCSSCNGNGGYFATEPGKCTKYVYVYTPLKPKANTNTVTTSNTTSTSNSSKKKLLDLFGLVIICILILK